MSLRFRDMMPRGLYARATAIIILPVAIMQIAIAYIFYDDLWNDTSRRLGDAFAGDIALSVELYEQDPSAENLQKTAALMARNSQIQMSFLPGHAIGAEKSRASFKLLRKTIKRSFRERVGRPFWFDARDYPRSVEVQVQVKGGVMRYIASGKRAYVTAGHVFLLWVISLTALLTTVSVLFIRNQVRPILRLAKVAEAFGRGEDAPEGYHPSGAKEVRQAAFSVLKMRERIKRHVEQRTHLLAAVSHDLRTPLTRLKLEVAMLPEGTEREAMRRDLSEMEHMLDEYLTFARGQWVEEPDPFDVSMILAEAAAPLGEKVTVDIEPDLVANVRPSAIKRCFVNLLSNAASHAARVELRARRAGNLIEIIVDDDGPGIPEDRRAEALTAFMRLDSSRNQNTKGVGLGLAIARDVARGHGGDLVLDASPLGGLRAIVRIPSSST